MYSEEKPTKITDFESAEDLLAAMRKGNTQKLEIGFGERMLPVRLISAKEELNLMITAASSSVKMNPSGLKQNIAEAHELMKLTLIAATTLNSVPGAAPRFFELLTPEELSDLYDQYKTLNHTINPNIELMKTEQIAEMIANVKKKQRAAKDYYTWQLAAIGKYFLDVIIPNLPTDNGAGLP